MNFLEEKGEGEKGTPLERGQAQEGLVVVMLTLEQLRLYGPIALREYLKRTQRAPVSTGEVVTFGHQETLPSGGGS